MKSLLCCSIATALMASSFLASADVEQRLKQLEKEIEQIRKESVATSSPSKVTLYGSFRPVLTAEDDGNDTALDVRDALSRFGMKGSTSLGESAEAYFVGEWKVKIQDAGDIDGTRLAHVGVRGRYGDVAIGTQRPPHYTLIAEHVDIFNHASSPYAYDQIGPFFIDNSVTYSHSIAGLDFKAAVRSDGPSGEDAQDMLNVGLGFNQQNFYLGVAYLKLTQPGTATEEPGDEQTLLATAASATLGDLYVAAAYQNTEIEPEAGGDSVEGSTLDVSLAYALASGYKVKAGVFDYDDGVDGGASAKFMGYNLTLERQLADNVRVHAEYLSKDIEEADTINALTLGIRYDFSADL